VSLWSDRKFEFHAAGGIVGRIMPTTGTFSFRPDSNALSCSLPVMSALEAISLAQALRCGCGTLRATAASRDQPLSNPTGRPAVIRQ
jgi:hypothetical protein